MKKFFISVVAVLCLFCCSMMPLKTPQTSGEMGSGYTYVPIDPFPVAIVPSSSCKSSGGVFEIPHGQLLEALPDNAVRMLVESFDVSGNVTYGGSKTGTKGEFFRVTIDFINADTINVPVNIKKEMRIKDGDWKVIDISYNPGPEFVPGSEMYHVERVKPESKEKSGVNIFNIPVYVGGRFAHFPQHLCC